jgi:hypothetical protein
VNKAKRVEIEGYISRFSPEMQNLALKLRELILKLEPDVDEVIKWKNLFYEKEGPVCAIVIHKSHLNLQFTRGREITQLGYPLEGTGKNIRHVKIKEAADINGSLQNLILKAFELEASS